MANAGGTLQHIIRENSKAGIGDGTAAARARELMSAMTPAEKCSQLSYDSPAIERLGIPAYNWWNECLHGVGRAGMATVFPQAIGLAASFNTALVQRVAEAISDEARAKHHLHAAAGDRGIYKGLTFWSPNINILRDPRWGRGQETYGECPYLTGQMGMTFVTGLQGPPGKHRKLDATPKHFAAHSGPEHGRHGFDVRVSPRDLHETYLPAFRKCIVEAGAAAVMGAYNRLNGEPCCASRHLLEEILRQTWGFQGYVVSDCGAITDIHLHHHTTDSPAESAALAVKNGLDLCCGSDYEHLLDALARGLLSEADIDRSLERLLISRLELGMLDSPEHVAWASIKPDVVDCPRHRDLALLAARESLVLLKNDRAILPLSKTIKSIAVIGPNADARQVLLGNYHGTPSQIVSPLDGIRRHVGGGCRVMYAAGCDHLGSSGAWLGAADRGFVEAVSVAEQCDVTVLCLGLTPSIEGEEGDAMNSDAGGDRTRIELPPIQRQLIEAVTAQGKPVVLVLISGSGIALAGAEDKVGAIVQQFYGGQAGGEALAEVIFGDYNPAGRLPLTVYQSTGDLPAFDDYSMHNRTYRFFAGKPLFPFGFGLSYSHFAYTEGRVPDAIKIGEPMEISLVVTNCGPVAGDTVVQLYLAHKTAAPLEPRRQLAGMVRLYLQPRETRPVSLRVEPRMLSCVSDDGSRWLRPGGLRVYVGGSQPDERSRELGADAVMCLETQLVGKAVQLSA